MATSSLIGKVKSIFVQPCGSNPEIWVTAAVSTLFSAFWTLRKPDTKEFIKLASGKSWLHHVRQEVYDVKEVTKVGYDLEFQAVFEAIEWYDLATWWLFIASVSIDFVANWHSLVMQVEGCTPARAAATQMGFEPFGFITTPHEWVIGPAWVEVFPEPGTIFGSAFGIPAGERATVTYSLAYEDVNGNPYPIACRLINVDTQQVWQETSIDQGAATSGASAMGQVIVIGDPIEGSQYQLQIQRTDNTGVIFLTPRDGRINVVIGNHDGWL